MDSVKFKKVSLKKRKIRLQPMIKNSARGYFKISLDEKGIVLHHKENVTKNTYM